MTVKSKIGTKLSQVSKRADMLGGVGGYLGTSATLSQSEGENFVEGLVTVHLNAVRNHNFLALQGVPEALVYDPAYNTLFIPGVSFLAAGAFAQYLPGFIPNQATIVSALRKLGLGLAVGAGVMTIIGKLASGSPSTGRTGHRARGGTRTGPGDVWQVRKGAAVTTAGRKRQPTRYEAFGRPQ